MMALPQPYPSQTDLSPGLPDLLTTYSQAQDRVRARWRSGQRLDDVFSAAIANAFEAGRYGSDPVSLMSVIAP